MAPVVSNKNVAAPAPSVVTALGWAQAMSDRTRTTNRFGTRFVAVVGAALLASASACEETPDSESTTVPTTAQAATTTAAPRPTSPPTTSVPVDLLASCVDYAKFSAYTGNEFWADVWAEAGETDSGMREVCEFLAAGEPGWLEGIHADWQALVGASDPAVGASDPPVDATDPAVDATDPAVDATDPAVTSTSP